MINLLLQLLYIQCVIFLFFFFYSLFQREKLGACLRIIEFFWCPGQKEERRNSNQILSVSNEIKNKFLDSWLRAPPCQRVCFWWPLRQSTIFLQNHQQKWCSFQKSILPSYLSCFYVLNAWEYMHLTAFKGIHYWFHFRVLW